MHSFTPICSTICTLWRSLLEFCSILDVKWTEIGAIDQLQIEEEGVMRSNVDFFLDQLDYKIAHPEEIVADSVILQEADEHFILLQGKPLPKERSYYVDETGRPVKTNTKALLIEREKQIRLKYWDNFYSRYVYYRTKDFKDRVKAFLGLGS